MEQESSDTNGDVDAQASLESLLIRLDVLNRHLTRLAVDTLQPSFVSQLANVISQLHEALDHRYSESRSYSYVAETELEAARGRPRLNIPKSQLVHLLETGFTCPQIACMLGVSCRTIHRRFQEYGLSVSSQYSSLIDSDLDILVSEIRKDFPNCGYTMMMGHLLSRGHRVQQTRVRAALIRADPDGVTTRWCSSVQRRTYNVYGPLALWHIDGNHKLVR